ncbi:uncharacterized protein tp53i13 isoform X2 [Engraulis encrasicolus]|uniref:uncharacterized protein tp53i13 isoform X2 n=1 Tax=Engraulis encrasicolus TaxID=184585 RepID=UPI002FD670A9
MTLRLVIILTGICWTYQSTKAIQLCDNGKFHVELDLPHPSALHCSEPLTDLVQQVFIDQKYPAPLQPVKHVCMDTPISYNATIPSRGDHRPVSAEPGVYLYCPPQRWLNNLQHGSIVVLHHPCAAEEERSRLAALALSCLPGFIMTPHPWLNKHRPLALVSWGRTLEMSHVTTSEVCDWLVSVSSENRRHTWPMKRPGERRFSLLLTHAAPPLQRPKESTRHTHAAVSHIDWLKNLRQCCEQTLSSPDQNGDTQPTDETTRTQRREEDAVRRRAGGERTQRRRKRAAIPPRQADQQETPISQVNNTTRLNNNNNNETDFHTAQLSQSNHTSTPSAGVLVDTHQPAAGTEPVGSTDGPGRVTAHLSPPKEDEEREQGGGGPKKKKEEELVVEKEVHTRTDMQGQGGGNSSGAPAATAAATGGGVGGGRGGNSSETVGALAGGDHSLGGAAVVAGGGGGGGGVSGIQGGNSSAGGHSSGGGVQRKVTGAARTKSHSHSSSFSSHTRAHSQSHRKERPNQNPAAAGGGGGGGGGVKTSARQRVREDTEEQERLEGLEHQGRAGGGGGGTSTEVPGPGFGGRVVMGSMGVGGGGDRFVTRRTDEAVWAAAALGFLLVLLTLSVLHTRLYRHWRTMPSLYWRDDTQDYDSVTDIIRRRLKLAGRRKRRAAAARRHEAPLLPNSSTDEEFE